MDRATLSDAVWEAAMFNAMAETGLTPEYLKLTSDGAEDFFSELEKLGYDVGEFFKEGEKLAYEWQKNLEKQEEFNNQQVFRARSVLQLLVNRPDDNSFDNQPLEEFEAKLEHIIRENLDANSIWEFVRQAWKLQASIQAKENALRRHKENHAMKSDVFAWLDKNFGSFKSMDSAAEAIAKCVAPIAFRTARDWVGEWKKLRSASRA